MWIASNKYAFRKVLQLGFRKSCFHKDSLVQNACTFASFCKYAFAEILGFACLKLLQICHRFSQAFLHFHKYAFAVIRNILQAFAICSFLVHSFASSQMDFRMDSLVSKAWFFTRIHNGHFADCAAHFPVIPDTVTASDVTSPSLT